MARIKLAFWPINGSSQPDPRQKECECDIRQNSKIMLTMPVHMNCSWSSSRQGRFVPMDIDANRPAALRRPDRNHLMRVFVIDLSSETTKREKQFEDSSLNLYQSGQLEVVESSGRSDVGHDWGGDMDSESCRFEKDSIYAMYATEDNRSSV